MHSKVRPTSEQAELGSLVLEPVQFEGGRFLINTWLQPSDGNRHHLFRNSFQRFRSQAVETAPGFKLPTKSPG